MPKLSTFRNKGRYPAAVYVAVLETGEQVRMSFWSDKRKPVDPEAGKRLIEQVTGARVAVGHAEWQGAAIVPAAGAPVGGAAAVVRPDWRKIAATARAALARGDVAQALALLERAA
jgi:hypothetical protein